MNPDQIEQLLTSYALGDLDADTARTVEAHLEHNEASRRTLSEIRETLGVLQRALQTPLPAGVDTLDPARRAAVLAPPEMEAAASRPLPLPIPWYTGWLRMAATLALTGGAVWVGVRQFAGESDRALVTESEISSAPMDITLVDESELAPAAKPAAVNPLGQTTAGWDNRQSQMEDVNKRREDNRRKFAAADNEAPYDDGFLKSEVAKELSDAPGASKKAVWSDGSYGRATWANAAPPDAAKVAESVPPPASTPAPAQTAAEINGRMAEEKKERGVEEDHGSFRGKLSLQVVEEGGRQLEGDELADAERPRSGGFDYDATSPAPSKDLNGPDSDKMLGRVQADEPVPAKPAEQVRMGVGEGGQSLEAVVPNPVVTGGGHKETRVNAAASVPIVAEGKSDARMNESLDARSKAGPAFVGRDEVAAVDHSQALKNEPPATPEAPAIDRLLAGQQFDGEALRNDAIRAYSQSSSREAAQFAAMQQNMTAFNSVGGKVQIDTSLYPGVRARPGRAGEDTLNSLSKSKFAFTAGTVDATSGAVFQFGFVHPFNLAAMLEETVTGGRVNRAELGAQPERWAASFSYAVSGRAMGDMRAGVRRIASPENGHEVLVVMVDSGKDPVAVSMRVVLRPDAASRSRLIGYESNVTLIPGDYAPPGSLAVAVIDLENPRSGGDPLGRLEVSWTTPDGQSGRETLPLQDGGLGEADAAWAAAMAMTADAMRRGDEEGQQAWGRIVAAHRRNRPGTPEARVVEALRSILPASVPVPAFRKS